jgi:thiol-disulfide isomerase/thioredoxin
MRLAFALLLATLAIAGGYVAGRLWWDPTPGQTRQADSEPLALTQVPVFSLADLNGQIRSISEWTSQTLIINFWATWCAPCRKEMPLLQQVHDERADRNFSVIGVAIDRPDPVQSFVMETGVTYPILIGQQDAMAIAESFSPRFVGLPLSVVSLPGGEIIKIQLGELHPEDLTAILATTDRVIQGELTAQQARKLLDQG